LLYLIDEIIVLNKYILYIVLNPSSPGINFLFPIHLVVMVITF